jgi:hypothetical protein
MGEGPLTRAGFLFLAAFMGFLALPAAALAARRAIWEPGLIQVMDGGPDGDGRTDDNTVFMTQGIFVP